MLNRVKRYIKQKLTKVEVKAQTIPILSGEYMKDKVALITGASEGIGYGIAEAFVAQGAKVVITGRNEEKLQLACERLNIDIECAKYIVWDHSDNSVLRENFGKAVSAHGKLDILVNNAGYHGNQNFFTISENDYDNTMNVNIKNVFFLSQIFARYLIHERKMSGHILNISSASSIKPAWSPYEISKWAVTGFTRGLARELAPYDIIVNGIAPGPTATSMSHWTEGTDISWPSIPKKRMALANEIGNLAVYLCSDLGDFIIGEVVFCDGGSGTLTMNK